MLVVIDIMSTVFIWQNKKISQDCKTGWTIFVALFALFTVIL